MWPWASLGTLLLLSATPLMAGELVLTWTIPADHTPKPESFLVSYITTDPAKPQQFRIPNLGRTSCDALTDPGLTADSICGRPPDCLPPGLYRFFVQSDVGGTLSEASNIANCVALPGCTYECASVTIPAALRQGTAPDPQAVQQAVEAMANAPRPPATPSVTTPAPTFDQVKDQVQTALNQLPPTPV